MSRRSSRCVAVCWPSVLRARLTGPCVTVSVSAALLRLQIPVRSRGWALRKKSQSVTTFSSETGGATATEAATPDCAAGETDWRAPMIPVWRQMYLWIS